MDRFGSSLDARVLTVRGELYTIICDSCAREVRTFNPDSKEFHTFKSIGREPIDLCGVCVKREFQKILLTLAPDQLDRFIAHLGGIQCL